MNNTKCGSIGSISEFVCGGEATILCDTNLNLEVIYARHMLNPHEEYYYQRFRSVVYSCID